MPKQRSTPDGFRKTSYELTQAAKAALEDLTRALDRDGYQGLAETTVLEALILTAKRDGIDRSMLDKAIRTRAAALQRAQKPG